jgi:hypothetical protein
MAQYENATAALRMTNAYRNSVCSLGGVDPELPAAVARNFVEGIEKLYNNGPLTARLAITKILA